MPDLHPDIARILISEKDILNRVAELAAEIDHDYQEAGQVVLIGILKGAFIFTADLSRKLTLPHSVDFMSISSYGDTASSEGAVRLIMDLRKPISNQHVIVVEDIVDSGHTMNYLYQTLLGRNPASLKTCSLFKKNRDSLDVPLDYVGFDLPDVWVVGYGLDYADTHRTLPYIAELKKKSIPDSGQAKNFLNMSNRERSIRTEGIILRRKDYGEADRILVMFSRKMGRISCLAKGSRKPTSKISGHLELFSRSSFLIAKGRNLHIISQAETIESYDGLRKDLAGIGRGSYLVELVDALTYEEGSNLKLYDLLLKTLESLNKGENPSVVIHYYELHLLDLVGFRPELFNCVECGKKIIEQDQFLSGELGGVICPACITVIPGAAVRPISARTLKYLRHFQRSSLQSLLKLKIHQGLLDDLEKIIQYYLTHTLERNLNSPDFNSRIRESK